MTADTDTTGLSSRFLSYLQDILVLCHTQANMQRMERRKNGA